MRRWLEGWLGRATTAPATTSPTPSRAALPVPREVLRQVRQIELRMRGLVDAIFGGEYHAVFRGQGMEFAEVREYQAGDDVRHIDWNVTARMGHPYVKKHIEERELTVLLAVDLSGSEQFATRGRFKAEAAAELAAVIALSAVRNNDRVGLILFTDRIEHVVPPGKGRKHVLRLIRDMLAFQPRGRRTDVADALDYAARLLPHRSIVFLMSDFIAHPGMRSVAEDARFERILKVVARRHDVVAVRIADGGELAVPDVGVLALVDPESGEEVVIDSGDDAFRSMFGRLVALERAELQRLFRRLGVDEIEITTDSPVARPLLSFFRRRERMQRR